MFNYLVLVVSFIINFGIGRVEWVFIFDELVLEDVKVEIVFKKVIGYYIDKKVLDENILLIIKGRNLVN